MSFPVELWVSPRGTHGKVATYRTYGCRCDLCTAAHTIYQRDKGYGRDYNRRYQRALTTLKQRHREEFREILSLTE
jgi:hypothetical protein